MSVTAKAARFNMIEAQIRPSNVTDPRIFAAMNAVAREKFVPRAAQALAYADVPVAIAPGRYLLDPRSFAKLLQLAQVTADDRVLDVGCGTGYSSAVLARLAAEPRGLPVRIRGVAPGPEDFPWLAAPQSGTP